MIDEFAKSNIQSIVSLCCKAVINALLSHKETVRKQNALSKANKKECKKGTDQGTLAQALRRKAMYEWSILYRLFIMRRANIIAIRAQQSGI
jgi:hypothetical protein